jgi:hypothetical protein
MREKLNENQTAQIALVAVLLLVVGFFAYKHVSGSSESAAATTESTAIESTPTAATSATMAPSLGKLPKAVESAYQGGSTVVLLFHRYGGIDDHLVKESALVLDDMSGVAYFSVPVDKSAKYAALTGPLGVSSAPAVVVVRRRALNAGGTAQASVLYGFQTASDLRQAVRDANYRGPRLTYAPQ